MLYQTLNEKKINANVDKSLKIWERDKEHYHFRINTLLNTGKPKPEDNYTIRKVSVKIYEDIKRNNAKGSANIKLFPNAFEEEIVHDPTLKEDSKDLEDIEYYRALYQEKFKKAPDKRMKLETLKKEVEE